MSHEVDDGDDVLLDLFDHVLVLAGGYIIATTILNQQVAQSVRYFY